MQEYFITKFEERAIRHQCLIYVRLQLEFKHAQIDIADGPWLRANDIVPLAFILIAYQMHACAMGVSPPLSSPSRDQNEFLIARGNSDWYLSIEKVESILRHQEDEQTPEYAAYADMLKLLWERLSP
ncbi:uncharacterized protein N7483_012885 [Penicillium malachiteum]|uniref:uncharacterized protein n=1 Tax=Penicillium malachiteum TaxID=1324776 RepID=UPI002547E994|nr:uncharacterized protein N7483_012885 [Penicillium malachiteum]KAJ5715704.1 hypothetical protein N7483_012885 [Penicillium malachiteum]